MTIQNTKSYVYGLVDPRTNIIKYIGVTKNSLRRRLCDHVRGSKHPDNGNKHKNYWLKELLFLDLFPEIVILEECENINDAFNAEIWWIAFLGFDNLTNLTDGGDFPPSWKGKKLTEEHKRNQSISISAYYAENEHPSKGVPLTEEHKAKVKETKIKNGTWKLSWTESFTEEEIKAIYQKRDTPEWRRKISKRQKAKLSIPENNPMYGKKQTEQSNEKNRLTNWMYHANRKEEWGLLFTLQEAYYDIVGQYQEKYLYPY